MPLTFEKDGVTYRKTFVLKRDSYDVGVNFEIVNQSGSAIEVEPYGQLKHTLVESSGNVAMPTYTVVRILLQKPITKIQLSAI